MMVNKIMMIKDNYNNENKSEINIIKKGKK